jgi:hypothetical protein
MSQPSYDYDYDLSSEITRMSELSSEYDPLSGSIGKKRRTSYSLQRKKQAVAELRSREVSQAVIAKEYGVLSPMIGVWKRIVEEEDDCDANADNNSLNLHSGPSLKSASLEMELVEYFELHRSQGHESKGM